MSNIAFLRWSFLVKTKSSWHLVVGLQTAMGRAANPFSLLSRSSATPFASLPFRGLVWYGVALAKVGCPTTAWTPKILSYYRVPPL